MYKNLRFQDSKSISRNRKKFYCTCETKKKEYFSFPSRGVEKAIFWLPSTGQHVTIKIHSTAGCKKYISLYFEIFD